VCCDRFWLWIVFENLMWVGLKIVDFLCICCRSMQVDEDRKDWFCMSVSLIL